MNDFINSLSWPKIIISLAMIVLAVLILWIVRHLIKKHRKENESQYTPRQKTVVKIAADIITFLILFITILVILQINGINVTALFAGLGIAGAVVGLALQDVIKDYVMGFRITTDSYFSVGNIVKFGDFEGEVISFSLKSTKIQSLTDRSVMTVSNRYLDRIVCVSDFVDIDVPLPYEEKTEKIDEVLESALQKIGSIEGVTSTEYKGTQDFGDSAVIYKIRFHCPPQIKPDTRRSALRIVQNELANAGIIIPFMQMDVHQK